MPSLLAVRHRICCPVPGRSPQRKTFPAATSARGAAALIFLCVLLCPVRPAGAELNEYQAKAGFVLNLVRFTEWPAREWGRSPELKICVIGSEPFDAAFGALKGKVVRGKPIAVSHLHQTEEIEGCHVLFIGESQRRYLPRILKHAGTAPILTVSEVDNFTESGGMVNLLVERNKTVLEVNNAAVRQALLKVSAQVLKAARKVTE